MYVEVIREQKAPASDDLNAQLTKFFFYFQPNLMLAKMDFFHVFTALLTF